MDTKKFGGPVLFLDRSDINTDEIIPAKYLTVVDKQMLAPHCLEDLKLDGFVPASVQSEGYRVIVTRSNFGCGSSREHAPWALEVNGITLVIAESYARIFRQNMFNGGMIAAELPSDQIDKLFEFGKGKKVTCLVDMEDSMFTFNSSDGRSHEVRFRLNQFDEALVKSGGWVEFADNRY